MEPALRSASTKLESGDALCFGHAVTLGEVYRLFFLVLAYQFDRHGRTSGHKKMHMGKVGISPGRGLGQHLEHHRHGKKIVDSLPADQVQDFRRIVKGPEDQDSAGIDNRCS